MATTKLTLNDHPVYVFFTYDEDDGLEIHTVEAKLKPTDSNPVTGVDPVFVDVTPVMSPGDFVNLERQIYKNFDRIVAEAREDAV